MRISFLAFFLLFSFGLQAQETLTPEQLQEDFRDFKEALYKHNKGLHLFVDEINFPIHLAKIEEQLTEEKSLLEFKELLEQAIIPVEERHLSLHGFHKKSPFLKQLNKKDSTAIQLLPLYVYFKNDSTAYILRNAQRDSSIILPSKLLSINGHSVNQIQKETTQYISQDHGISAWKNWELSQTLPFRYYNHVDTSSTFIIECQDEYLNIGTDTLQGMPRKVYTDSIKKQSRAIFNVEKLKPGLRYQLFDSLRTGYLKIGSFKSNKQSFDHGTVKFKHVVDDFFEQVEAKNHQNIIIDLRNNTGGRVTLLKYLLAYIQPTDEKIPMYKQLKNRDYWWGEIVREEKTTKQRQPHFDGQVYILTNGGSYSASVMFSVYAKKFTNAIIVGEPAGGRPTGTTAGSFHIERLKHSNILVRIPKHIFYYFDDMNIEPDIYVQPKLEDFFSYDSDFQLETILQLISDEQ